ncbi:hypothetical protein FQN60_012574 [Etheostoma spectabile]|uniref:Uncharacterized protein n=1 Tax=Etheostoma spectabile TaxID=54343 RepID=A0A5J5C809_9PERO|nr:hypothetical protein FQN60_012574 [Etheostoma spectabile]
MNRVNAREVNGGAWPRGLLIAEKDGKIVESINKTLSEEAFTFLVPPSLGKEALIMPKSIMHHVVVTTATQVATAGLDSILMVVVLDLPNLEPPPLVAKSIILLDLVVFRSLNFYFTLNLSCTNVILSSVSVQQSSNPGATVWDANYPFDDGPGPAKPGTPPSGGQVNYPVKRPPVKVGGQQSNNPGATGWFDQYPQVGGPGPAKPGTPTSGGPFNYPLKTPPVKVGGQQSNNPGATGWLDQYPQVDGPGPADPPPGPGDGGDPEPATPGNPNSGGPVNNPVKMPPVKVGDRASQNPAYTGGSYGVGCQSPNTAPVVSPPADETDPSFPEFAFSPTESRVPAPAPGPLPSPVYITRSKNNYKRVQYVFSRTTYTPLNPAVPTTFSKSSASPFWYPTEENRQVCTCVEKPTNGPGETTVDECTCSEHPTSAQGDVVVANVGTCVRQPNPPPGATRVYVCTSVGKPASAQGETPVNVCKCVKTSTLAPRGTPQQFDCTCKVKLCHVPVASLPGGTQQLYVPKGGQPGDPPAHNPRVLLCSNVEGPGVAASELSPVSVYTCVRMYPYVPDEIPPVGHPMTESFSFLTGLFTRFKSVNKESDRENFVRCLCPLSSPGPVDIWGI